MHEPIDSPVDQPRIEKAVREILEAIGEDPARDGLVDTPARVARMYAEVFAGLREAPDHHLQVVFDAEELAGIFADAAAPEPGPAVIRSRTTTPAASAPVRPAAAVAPARRATSRWRDALDALKRGPDVPEGLA